MIGAAVTIGLLCVMTAFVLVPVARDLARARSVLDQPLDRLDADEVADAARHLSDADERLDSLPGRILRVIPLLGSNLQALHTVASRLPEVLDIGLVLKERVEELEGSGLLDERRVNVAALTSLEEPLTRQAEVLGHFADEVGARRTGALLPPLWDQMDELYREARDLEGRVTDLRDFVGISEGLFGVERDRRYLVLLLNNAELRGAGGILAGVGTISVRDAEIDLGRFVSVHDLQRFPPRAVDAPAEYERRYSVFEANTTLWLNTSYSPDVPDVATVAANLYQEVVGTRVDGALVLDPRGVAALIPPDREISVTAEDDIPAEDLARFVYSDAYSRFSDQSERRDVILRAGSAALRGLLQGGLGEAQRDAAAAAAGGGHIAFASFDEREAQILGALGISRPLEPPTDDVVHVVVQNMGGGGGLGSKLDYWTEREVDHACDLSDGDTAECATEVRLDNGAPTGLTRYVAGRPYGLLRSYVESYLPLDADVLEVNLNGEPAEFRLEEQSGRSSVAVYAETPRQQTSSVYVRYAVPLRDGRFRIDVFPQPLARDAQLRVQVAVPDGWEVAGGGAGAPEGAFELTAELTRPLHLDFFEPEARGLTALWKTAARFWDAPLFED